MVDASISPAYIEAFISLINYATLPYIVLQELSMESSACSLFRAFLIIGLAANALGFLIDFLLNKKPLSLFISIGSAGSSLGSLCCINAPHPHSSSEVQAPIAIIEEKDQIIEPSAPPLEKIIP